MNQPIPSSKNDQNGFQFLVNTVRTLRDPDGCPWDAEQTHQSLRPNLLEEAYEMLEAIENADTNALEEELGDVMIQIVFHADIARRNGDFDASTPSAAKVAEKADPAPSPRVRRRRETRIWRRRSRSDGSASNARKPVASDPSSHQIPKALPRARAISRVATPNHARRIANRKSTRIKPQIFPERLSRRIRRSTRNPRRPIPRCKPSAPFRTQGVDARNCAAEKSTPALRNRVLRAEELAEGTALAELDEPEPATVSGNSRANP